MTSSSVSTTADPLPGYDDVVAASERLAGLAVKTPLLESPQLNALAGGRILIKPEVLQRTGSFKFRGAFNRISTLPEEARRNGIIAYSSGNHAQGVAAAAQLQGIAATIVMPADAPRIKVENTRSYGAEVILYDRYHEVREDVTARLREERGSTLVKPYDDPFVIAGQGTCGLEIARQAEAMGAELDAVLICCGGGGLSAGSALALRRLSPHTDIYTVEPEGFDDTARSIEAGERVANPAGGGSICDALLAPTPGELTFTLNKDLLSGGLAVSDDEVTTAMRTAFQMLKLVVEPGGAVALAAVLSGKLDLAGRTVAVVLSGGNVDAETFCRLVTGKGGTG
ncbi:MAG: threonine/serine dehydratase [Rhodovibrionaceae bacterium]|nr:threonine/serine dehydratase [Rhodovibrionaceae bacterium]